MAARPENTTEPYLGSEGGAGCPSKVWTLFLLGFTLYFSSGKKLPPDYNCKLYIVYYMRQHITVNNNITINSFVYSLFI